LELKDAFSKHPAYQKVVPYIQNKYAFDERPQFGLVVKGVSSNKIQLSSENFVGTVTSKVMLAHYEAPSYLLEWVREDSQLIFQNHDVMPIHQGIYVLECLSAPTTPGEEGEYSITPFLTSTDEPLIVIETGVESEAQLQNPPVQGTVRLWENRRYLLKEGEDYQVDYRTGLVTITGRLQRGATVTADYRYAIPAMGPFKWMWNKADYETLPGVVLAFGKRGKVGDKVAVVVTDDRTDTANAYGGKFEVSFDIDVIATDPMQMEEMADYTFMTFWGEKRATLAHEGIEVSDVSMGGEAEESYDEAANLFFYTASMSIQLQSDWEIHVPLPFTVSQVTGGPQPLTQGLLYMTSPIVVGRNNSFERIT
jgi:hypothetical protein